MKKYILFVLLINFYSLFSQELINTEGKDFWITFLPNFHNDRTINKTDSLYIFISAKQPTKGQIVYRDKNGNTRTQSFRIDNPDNVYTFVVSYFNYELRGFNNSGEFDNTTNQCEQVARQYFRVISDENVSVYALNQANLTSEAFMVLPADVLGNEYYILTYNSDGKDNSFNQITVSSTPSQFTVLAIEDSTVVDIYPSTATYVNGTNPRRIFLNAGESYLVQARITVNNLYSDLTGSFIKANRPVAVFAGHQRAAIPVGVFTNNPSRDHLCEQMIPTSAWGKNAIAVPFAKPANIVQTGNDLVRIMASNDNTTVKIENSETTINAGKFIELPLTDPMFIEADKPILVAQYKKTSNSGSSRNNISDPLMLIVPPVEQYITSYRIINAQATGYEESTNKTFKAYDEQYVAIIADQIAYNFGISINDVSINQSLFRQIPGKNYYWANVRVSDGVNNLYSLGKFAVFVYGYGQANSYGYLGGMGMATIDVMPPEIFTKEDCFKIYGTVADSNITDSKLKSVQSTFSNNVKLKIDSISKLIPISKFEAELENKFLDGQFNIIAQDALGQITEKTFDIPGFTVSTQKEYSNEVIIRALDFVVGDEVCFNVNIYNYGKFNVEIDTVYFKNKTFNLKFPNNNFSLPSKDSISLEFCSTYSKDTILIDTLIIGNSCIKRNVLLIQAVFLSDTSAPQILLMNDICNTFFEYDLLENRAFDTGIKEIIIEKNINCKIDYDLTNNKQANLKIEIINPREDAEFKVIVIDKNNKSSIIEKYIAGFTLTSSFMEDSMIFSFDTTQIGDLICRTIDFYNYGKSELVIKEIYLDENIFFSLPQSQIPFKLKPKERKELKICFNPIKANTFYSDTLLIDYNCIITKIPISGLSRKQNFVLNSKCDVKINFEIRNVQNRVSIHPIPINNIGIIKIPILENSNYIKVEIFNIYGKKLFDLFEGNRISGDLKLVFDATSLPSGSYFLVVYKDNSRESIPFLILR